MNASVDDVSAAHTVDWWQTHGAFVAVDLFGLTTSLINKAIECGSRKSLAALAQDCSGGVSQSIKALVVSKLGRARNIVRLEI